MMRLQNIVLTSNNQSKIKMSGIVDKVLSPTQIMVTLENKLTVVCHISKKIRKFNLNIFPGDMVDVEMSMMDLSAGRIIHRYITK